MLNQVREIARPPEIRTNCWERFMEQIQTLPITNLVHVAFNDTSCAVNLRSCQQTKRPFTPSCTISTNGIITLFVSMSFKLGRFRLFANETQQLTLNSIPANIHLPERKLSLVDLRPRMHQWSWFFNALREGLASHKVVILLGRQAAFEFGHYKVALNPVDLAKSSSHTPGDWCPIGRPIKAVSNSR